MLNFILRRLALIVPTVIGISLCAFFFVRVLPGDPILAMAGQHGVTPERYEILREQFGYNLPIWQQYFNYLGNVLQGAAAAALDAAMVGTAGASTPAALPQRLMPYGS